MYKYIGVVLCNKYELKINFLFLPDTPMTYKLYKAYACNGNIGT